MAKPYFFNITVRRVRDTHCQKPSDPSSQISLPPLSSALRPGRLIHITLVTWCLPKVRCFRSITNLADVFHVIWECWYIAKIVSANRPNKYKSMLAEPTSGVGGSEQRHIMTENRI